MHRDLKIVSTEIPVNDADKMAAFQQAMDSLAEQTDKYIQKLAKKLNISRDCAQDVWYLRTRSRWTQDLEKELIRLHRAGKPPNIFDWP